VLTGVLLPGIPLVVRAFDTISLHFARIDGERWSARDVGLTLVWIDDKRARLELRAATVVLPEPVGRLTHVAIDCPAATYSRELISCSEGRLQARSSVLDPGTVLLGFEYRPRDGTLVASASKISLLGGTAGIGVRLTDSGWRLDVEAEGMDATQAIALMASLGYDTHGYTASGDFNMRVEAGGQGSYTQFVKVSADTRNAGFSDQSGDHAGEGLAVDVDMRARRAGAEWSVALGLAARHGELYLDPLYLRVPDSSLRAMAQCHWSPAHSRLNVSSIELSHPGVLSAHATGEVQLSPELRLGTVRVDIGEGHFPAMYQTYLQPVLVGTTFSDLETEGRLKGFLVWKEGGVAELSVTAHDLSFTDRAGRYGVQDVQARIRWADDQVARKSEIAWSGGSLYRIPLGPASMAVETRSSHVALLGTATIPILDGELQVDAFSLDEPGSPQMRWNFEALLTPVSMTELTRYLGWPSLAGKLSGVIPAVHYDAGVLDVDGVLLVRAFDGDITLDNLRMETPFGLVPRLWVDVAVKNIDLDTLTRRFSFGKIEGRLSGYVDKLYMEDWRPVSFDASFFTPPDDNSRHRISQKAVDSLSSIGGGVGGALSRSFLRVLEDFPYDRLGISCRLANGVCVMDGVAPAKDGYYIVKGRFIPPRLDVVGYARQVDWDSLLARVEEQIEIANQGQAPAVR
jgi:hypothetical protein